MNFITWKPNVISKDDDLRESVSHLIAQVVFKHMDRVLSHFKKDSRDVEGLLRSRLCKKKILVYNFFF